MAGTFTCRMCHKLVQGEWIREHGHNVLYHSDGTPHHLYRESEVNKGKWYGIGCVNTQATPEQVAKAEQEVIGIQLTPTQLNPTLEPSTMEKVERAITASQSAFNMATNITTLAAQTKEEVNKLYADFSKLDAKWTAIAESKKTVEIKHPNGTIVDVGRQHKMFPVLVKRVVQAKGRAIVFMYGEPGGMKTSAVKPLAKALGDLPFWVMSMNQQTSRAEILGFINGTGNYMETPLYKAVKNGGLVLIDEIDASNANVLTGLNTAATNEFVGFPNGETVFKHPNCYIIAAGNTVGAGADTEFVGRQQLDMATRTRFVFVRWDTDWELVADIVAKTMGKPDWAAKVKFVHDVLIKHKIRFVASTRIVFMGMEMLMDGETEEDVWESMLWPNISPDEKEKVKRELAVFGNENGVTVDLKKAENQVVDSWLNQVKDSGGKVITPDQIGKVKW